MQISQSTNTYVAKSASSSSASGAKSPDQSFGSFFNDGDYASKDNGLFKNLLQDPELQDNYVRRADGGYEFIPDVERGLRSTSVSILANLIEEQNGYDYNAVEAVGLFTPNELAAFRQMTGYNLVQAGGMVTVTDDYGRGVPAADQAQVMAAWEAFDVAKGIQEYSDPGGELTVADIQSAARWVAEVRGGDAAFWDDIFNMIDGLASSDSPLASGESNVSEQDLVTEAAEVAR
ncbi:hypothetical protein [Rhizobium rhizophilum]|uniref:RTX toxin n=1 Tax=Rhizobium rhizophilum TaxID=1850373 RepID=A0ABY2QYZ5_9HYPH|nr:hypothetical protein [Rhizobium rhizophilum]THV15146.1 hypothetical protein E9677_07215 [Rhizobium rhizophilum]